MTTAGGMVFRVGDQLWFLPATVALEVVAVPEVARVPGAPPELLGVAVHEGDAIPVVTVGTSRACMLVCTYLGERVGLVGLEVEATGRFEPVHDASLHGESVLHRGRRVRLFDISVVVTNVCGARWATNSA